MLRGVLDTTDGLNKEFWVLKLQKLGTQARPLSTSASFIIVQFRKIVLKLRYHDWY
jgi:hypothetical protein